MEAIFGALPDGSEITEVVIAAGDLTANIINYGAIIRDIRLAGIDHPLVLGFDRLDDYLQHSPYFGAVPGRSANRIGGGKFEIDGKPYQLSLNENGRTHLHGGFHGFGKRAWRFVAAEADSCTLAIAAADGEEGYPGNVAVTCRYSIEPPGTVRYEFSATTDAPTLVNLAQHSYFNLDDSPDILDHRVRIFAEAYTPFDADSVPTGEIAPVAGTDYDFREERPIHRPRDGGRVHYDMNFAVAGTRAAEPRPMARLTSPKNGVSLEVSSTEPGIQFYDGSWMNVPVPGLGGRAYGVSAGCCFESQLFPDAPNHRAFQSSVLRPGETYRQVSRFAFSRS
jgi:aldose 1-epimerase